MRSFSTYISDDGRAIAKVYANGITGLRVVCSLDEKPVAVVNTFATIDDAEDFAEDFVTNKNKKEADGNYRKPSVLHRIAEPNERDSQPCMA
jgi:hypothetical protein